MTDYQINHEPEGLVHGLFVYGTLIIPEVQQNVFGRVITGIPDSLADFSKITITLEGTEYPAIIPEAGNTVNGWLLQVSSAELYNADLYETEAYLRTVATLKSGKEAFVYQVLSKT